MAPRGLEVRRPGRLVERILETPDLARVVQALEPAVLYRLVRKCGLEESGQLVALATTEQLMRLFDDDLWGAEQAGEDEALDAERFGLWLEVLVEAGADLAARRVAEMDFDFVTAAVSRLVVVVDPEWLALGRAAALEPDEADAFEAWLARVEQSLEAGLSHEIGGFRVLARRTSSWDALLLVLTSLDARHRAFFGRLMTRCSALSIEYIADNGGLYEVLSTEEQVLADVAAEREDRRERAGYVAPQQAAAFLKLARQPFGTNAAPGLDPVTVAYFRSVDQRAPKATPGDATEPDVRRFLEVLREEGVLSTRPPALLTARRRAGQDRLARIRTALFHAREHDAEAYARRTAELGYLANVLIAGCSFQSRRFRPVEATDAVLAACNLGLETWQHPAGREPDPLLLVGQDLVAVFRRGFRLLYEQVCLGVARGLVAVLADVETSDAQLRRDLRELRQRMTSALEAGTPWRERDRLDVLALLDQPAWVTLLGLVDECPVVPKASGARPLRVSREFEFISEQRQVDWARDFVRSLPGCLVA